MDEVQQAAKPDRYWYVTFHKNGIAIGPTWEVVSKIKPTKWAKEHVIDAGKGCEYTIEEAGGLF